VKNQQILTCPDSPYGKVVSSGADKGLPVRSYAMPRYVGDPWGTNNAGLSYYCCCIDYPPMPSDTVLLMEKGARGIGYVGDAAGEAFYQSHSCTGQGLKKDMFHNGGKNFCFVDGHVKWYKDTAGPFAYDSGNGGAEPPAGSHPQFEVHGPGHCEFFTDWPHE
jgi:prepilin-type processing-associated H-X9-DG protein